VITDFRKKPNLLTFDGDSGSQNEGDLGDSGSTVEEGEEGRLLRNPKNQ
jgi:hypothetical protein